MERTKNTDKGNLGNRHKTLPPHPNHAYARAEIGQVVDYPETGLDRKQVSEAEGP